MQEGRLVIEGRRLLFTACNTPLSRRPSPRTGQILGRVLGGRVAWSIEGEQLVLSKKDEPTLHYVRQSDAQQRRVFAYRRVGVVVPRSWAKNDPACGAPRRNTVVYPAVVAALCAHGRPPGVSAIEFGRLDASATGGTNVSKIEIDGERAFASSLSPGDVHDGLYHRFIEIPGRKVSLQISTPSAREAAELEAGIYVLPG